LSNRFSNISSTSAGSPKMFLVDWQTFVRSVLNTTVNAYEEMKQHGAALPTWEEDSFTVDLVEHMRNIAYASHLRVTYQFAVNTNAIKSGNVSPKKASRIDIQLYGTWERDYDNVYFAWECKRIGSASSLEGRKLISEYVTNGILRFIKKHYSKGLGTAGMLGYVLDGAISDIADSINKSMVSQRRRSPLTANDHLTPIITPKDSFISRHLRDNESPIELYHLFLTFSWGNQEDVAAESG
jgi:hypothetical protein